MIVMDAFDKVLQLSDGPTGLARRLGYDQPRVSHWRRRGVPADEILRVCRAVGWAVTPHEINPTIYPNPTDGIPGQVLDEERAA
jgi:DNA-binding transcriptional regulator YdaS (Cro superfamily)